METLTPTYANGQITQTENFSFLSQPHSSFLSISLPSLSFWGYSSGLLNTRIVRVPAIVHHHICFHFQQYLLKISLLISHFIRQLPKWLSIFMTCYMGLTVSYKKEHNYMLHCPCMNWITVVQWTITNRLRKKTMFWLVTDNDAHLFR